MKCPRGDLEVTLIAVTVGAEAAGLTPGPPPWPLSLPVPTRPRIGGLWLGSWNKVSLPWTAPTSHTVEAVFSSLGRHWPLGSPKVCPVAMAKCPLNEVQAYPKNESPSLLLLSISQSLVLFYFEAVSKDYLIPTCKGNDLSKGCCRRPTYSRGTVRIPSA